jgi:hypothetical protein
MEPLAILDTGMIIKGRSEVSVHVCLLTGNVQFDCTVLCLTREPNVVCATHVLI